MDASSSLENTAPCQNSIGSRGIASVTTSSILVAASITVVSIRLCVRKYIVKALWWDDLAIVVALLLYLPSSILGYLLTTRGIGRHSTCIPATTIRSILTHGLAIEILNSFSVTIARVSIALTVARLFGASLRFKLVLYAYTAFMTVVSVVTAGLFGAVCGPGNERWDPDGPGRCWPQERIAAVSYLNGGVSLLSDLVLAALPVYFLCKLQMPAKKKVGLCALMSLGLIIECGLAITAGSFPALWPLISRRKGKGSTRSSEPVNQNHSSGNVYDKYAGASSGESPSDTQPGCRRGAADCKNVEGYELDAYQAQARKGSYGSQEDTSPLVDSQGIRKTVDIEAGHGDDV
ncbi:MAG: hypothetical protein M1831_001209 [Alyxoria varia]|nr:MAG: hypothetical protein M1831_001209 [Alyxoria varia]